MQAAILLPRHKLTVDHYHKMAETGILTALDRVELIEGELIDMAPIGSRHATRVDYLNRLLVKQVSDDHLVRVQNPVRLGKHSEPEPDIAIVHNRRYSKAHPIPKDVLLLIEVADTTVQYDREIKVPLYARHHIPEVWLLDLPKGCLEIYLQPGKKGYRQILLPDPDETISPSLVPEVSVRIAELFEQ
jgi:Uma2 family endonuclease